MAAPPETVASVLLDADAAPLWTHGLERLELVKGEPGAPGSVGIAHYVDGRRRYALEDRLIDATPNRYYRSEISGGGFRATIDTALVPVAGGTRLTLDWSGRGTNPISWAVLALSKRRIRYRAEMDLEALRELVERRANDGGS